MISDTQFLEVRNFFEDPISVREIALTREYMSNPYTSESIWSGYRSSINDNKIESELHKKITKYSGRTIKKMSSCFHLNSIVSMHGFPHKDSTDENSFAGVIYLNDKFPSNCGTTIYQENDHNIVDYRDKMEIVYCTTISPKNQIKKKLSDECLDYKEKLLTKRFSFDFEFNKMICYPGNVLHSPDFYFGNKKSNSRLTVVFHGTFHAN